jgi:transcriptional regulator with XRE-family HTH domain
MAGAGAGHGSLGRVVELRRTALGMKRRDLAERAQLSYPYISEIENGIKEPSAKALRQVAEALDLSVAELAALTERVEEAADEPSMVLEAISGPVTDPRVGFTRSQSSASPLQPMSYALMDDLAVRSEPGDEAWRDRVAEVVREELERWAIERLPELIRSELARLDDRPSDGREGSPA